VDPKAHVPTTVLALFSAVDTVLSLRDDTIVGSPGGKAIVYVHFDVPGPYGARLGIVDASVVDIDGCPIVPGRRKQVEPPALAGPSVLGLLQPRFMQASRDRRQGL
jgi:hypothetical protein